jgi:hypothetical protein
VAKETKPLLTEQLELLRDKTQDSQVWKSIFRPGSFLRKGYRDTSRDRALATMNNVLYHLHPVKVKRHGLKLTYTFCLGGLSFFLFTILTITGIYLMFFYRPSVDLQSAAVYKDMQDLSQAITFGQLVRNMHRWAAHLMVLTVFLHMARVFYHGAYKPPREFNWVVGVNLLQITLLLSFTGYLLRVRTAGEVRPCRRIGGGAADAHPLVCLTRLSLTLRRRAPYGRALLADP